MTVQRKPVGSLWLIAVLIALIRFASIASAQDDPDTKHDIVRAGQRSYEVLQYSPDHHYAVVWGMSKRQVDFAHFDADAIDSGDIVNCIVDCLSHELVAILAGFEHFPSRNHSSLEITWEKHGRHAFVIWQSKWNPEGYALVDLVGSHRGRQTDLAGFESALQERVRLATGELPAVPYPALECTGTFAANGDLEINGHVYPSKWPNGWFYDCTLIYSLDNYGTITSIQPRPVGMVRARRSVLTSGDSGETYPRSDAVAVYSVNNRLRTRMKIAYAIITGSDKLYQRSMTVERFGDNGKRSWSVDAYPAVRREVLSRVQHLLPSVNLSQSIPRVTLTMPDELKYNTAAPDLFPFNVSVEAMAVNKRWGYSAQIVYRINSASQVPGVRIATIMNEASNATGKTPKLPGTE